jgi:N-acetylmuramoyl-L-alanine amidase
MPAVLIECGVIVNRKEELLITSNKFKQDLSNAIVSAIVKYQNRN